MEDSIMLEIRSFLDGLANERGRSQVDELVLRGLTILHLKKGILQCKFCITERVSAEDGVLNAGAIAGAIDVISYATVYSLTGNVHVTLSLNSLFYSTANIQEEVEIEGKVTGIKGNLKSLIVEIRREKNRQVIASASLWMAHLALASASKTCLLHSGNPTSN